MTIRYSTTDLARWGGGIGTLTPAQLDENFWTLFEDIQGFIFKVLPLSYVGISSMQKVSGSLDEFTVTLDDHAVDGPFQLLYDVWRAKGRWQADIDYAVNDIVTYNGVLYRVIFAHTSRATFAAGANDGKANDFYKVIAEITDDELPAGGLAGDALTKFSGVDYDTQWGPLVEAASVPASGFGPVSGFDSPSQVLSKLSAHDYDAAWLNPAKVPIPSTPLTASGTFQLSSGTHNQFYDYVGAATMTALIPPHISGSPIAPAPIGSEWTFRQGSTGIIVVEGMSGVTVNGITGYHDQTGVRGAAITLKKVDDNEYDLFGVLAS